MTLSNSRNPNYQALLDTLYKLPSDWELVPIGSSKQPYSRNFLDTSIKRNVIASHIKDGFYVPGDMANYAWGFSLKTGNGLVAIDIDGLDAGKAFIKESNKHGVSTETVSWTSGKPHRCQLLYRLPIQYHKLLEGFIRLPLRQLGDSTFSQDLDIRYDRCVSVLPPSHHPESNGYRWIKDPFTNPIAPLPLWICELVHAAYTQKKTLRSDRLIETTGITVTISRLPVDLLRFVTKDNRDLIASGVSENRNATAFRLGCDLVGAENFLNAHGQSFTGSAETLFYNFCAQCPCDEDWKLLHWQSVWHSVNSKLRLPATKETTLISRLNHERKASSHKASSQNPHRD